MQELRERQMNAIRSIHISNGHSERRIFKVVTDSNGHFQKDKYLQRIQIQIKRMIKVLKVTN